MCSVSSPGDCSIPREQESAPIESPAAEVFNNRAIVADMYTIGFGVNIHEIGLPVLRRDGSVFPIKTFDMERIG